MESVSRIIRDIKSIKIQGAREVAKAGLRALEITARKSKAGSRKELLQELQKTSQKLIKIRPTEPALQNSVAGVLVQLRHTEMTDLKKFRKHAVKVLGSRIKELDKVLEKISQFGSGIIQDRDTILTHCHSHTVIEIFRKAKAGGKKFQVIATETRPLYQGLKTAKELLKAGIPVIYCIDSATGAIMGKATKVLVGCDAILPDGSIVNKIGTLPIAIVAKRFGKPFYVAGETIKFTKKIEIEHRNPKEVTDPKKIPGAKIINPAFDVVPAEFIEAIITEKGITEPACLRM